MRHAPSPVLLLIALALGQCSGGRAPVTHDVVGDAVVPPPDVLLLADVGAPTLSLAASVPESSPAGTALAEPVTVRVRDGSGPVENFLVTATVRRGGGSVAPETQVTDPSGLATFTWTLGPAPVGNELELTTAFGRVTASTNAALAAPLLPEPFGDLNDFLENLGDGVSGGTEDLAFSPDGSLVVSAPGGLAVLAPDGTASWMALSGDPLVFPLGIAYDREGRLWVADSEGPALRRVSPAGVVTTIRVDDGVAPFQAPNYVAVGPAGEIFLSDPCLGVLVEVDPESGEVTARLPFDRASDGGPNGLAVAPRGDHLLLLTENTGILCGQGDVDPFAEVAGLYEVALESGGFGPLEPIAPARGLFGDGLAFDAEENLYVVFDRFEGLSLAVSAVWVRRRGEDRLVPFLRFDDRLIANLAFGAGEFGEEDLYLSLLSVAGATAPEARGVVRATVGVPGWPLLP